VNPRRWALKASPIHVIPLTARLAFFVIALFPLLAATALHAQTISGVVQDPTGAVIPGARIEINGGDLIRTVELSTDNQGKFTSPKLKPGSYTVRALRDGFEPVVKAVELHAAAQLQFTLNIAKAEEDISVSGKAFANSDPVYKQLRTIGLGETFRLENFTLEWDVGTFQFEKGSLTALEPINGVVTGAIFIGEGKFRLKPVLPLDANELRRRTGGDELYEEFTEVIFRFTRDALPKLAAGIGEKIPGPPEAFIALKHWQERMRQRGEVDFTFTQYLLQGETMDNVDADILAASYNPAHPPFFNAYMRGKKHKDLRFFVRNRVGAIPQIDSPEEVGLINYDPESLDDGIWYLSHLKSEFENHTASSRQERRLFATHRYKIETVIARNGHLFSTATVTFESLVPGERVLKFGLLPNLRVSRVLSESAQNLYYIQESRKKDGAFYVILPEAPPLGKEQSLTVEYSGDKVLEQAGEGSFYVAARTSWYPNLNGFGEHSLYDLTFKVPKFYKVISVGDLESESVEGDLAVSHWVTPVPVAVAGFNYGAYEKMDMADDVTKYKISGYYLAELPNNLRDFAVLKSMAPHAMTKYVLEQARSQMELCTYYFGRSPYPNINITEQPDFAFGQSWPTLVYLPISAYMDSTQRWLLFNHIDAKFTGFVREVTPHEVAHQWWGHAVSWASYHDQWLSEGFAEFSAGLFLQQAMGKGWQKDYIDFWARLHARVVEKNNWGVAPNDAGPLWMGERLISPRSKDAYQNLTYPKGAYVLAMLRSMMYDPEVKEGDRAFIDMMHDFVESHRDRPASTESFKVVAEKHITKTMDLAKNGRLDWFFNEWVYGTQIPKYKFDYQISPAEGAQVKVHLTVTQSEVDEHFAMVLPIFADYGTGNGMIPVAQMAIGGNTTRSVDMVLPSKPKKIALNAYKEILER
jgi:Peptidase family M1 domain/Carboxypeptidase regulatory-like domain